MRYRSFQELKSLIAPSSLSMALTSMRRILHGNFDLKQDRLQTQINVHNKKWSRDKRHEEVKVWFQTRILRVLLSSQSFYQSNRMSPQDDEDQKSIERIDFGHSCRTWMNYSRKCLGRSIISHVDRFWPRFWQCKHPTLLRRDYRTRKYTKVDRKCMQDF